MKIKNATKNTYHNNIMILNYIIQAISNQLNHIYNEFH
jgi:hypothetical protein